MKTTITILIDNTAGGAGTVGEHGFSVWISRHDTQVLFDTGAGQALDINLKALKKDIQDPDLVVLSHGHYDHTGGLKRVVEPRNQTDILAHPDVFQERFSARNAAGPESYRQAGMPFSRKELEADGARFTLTREYHEFAPGMFFSGEVPRPRGREVSDNNLLVRNSGGFRPDALPDDASLLIETDSGPVVLFGCAHAGPDVILDHLSEKSGHGSFHAVIGGTHLMRAKEHRIRSVIRCLEKYRVQTITPTHCTGFPAAAAFYQHFREGFRFGQVGLEFEF